jgi:hypothetical protein
MCYPIETSKQVAALEHVRHEAVSRLPTPDFRASDRRVLTVARHFLPERNGMDGALRYKSKVTLFGLEGKGDKSN